MHDHHHEHTSKLTLAFVLNLGFTIFEFIGGLITNSIALISDSIHDLGDSLTIGLSIYFERKAKKKPDEKFTYGYRRYSLLGGLITACSLIVGATIIIIESVKRLLDPQLVDTEVLLYFAGVGIIVNGIAAIVASKGKSVNEKVISLHLFEDVIGWFVLLVGAIIMHLTGILVLDAILSILFTLFILWHVYKHLAKIIAVFLERAPEEPSINAVRETLMRTGLVKDIHHMHYWTLEGEKQLFTAHVVISDSLDKAEWVTIQKALHQELVKIGVEHATFEFEFESEPCVDECESE
ncbi:MAG: cation transporter [Bacilli bacterium]|nr:cation transporter [Bacilli bacterium]MBN2696345.1 cation transporter [Bacilli bacterium]